MHTVGRDSDTTWCVMRPESATDGRTTYSAVFNGLTLQLALQTANVLNGGDFVMIMPALETLEQSAPLGRSI
jgi:hypothetical protein